MGKGKKKLLALGLSLSVLCSSLNAGAAYNSAGVTQDKLRCDEKCATNSELVITAYTSIDISGKTASLGVGVTCEADATSIEAELILQIYAESAWPKVTSWTYTKNSSILTMSREFTLNSGGKYRTKCVITAHRGSQEEKIEIYSGEKTYVKPSIGPYDDSETEEY